MATAAVRKSSRVRVRVGRWVYAATATPLDRERDATEWRTVQELARKKYGWGEGLPVRITPWSATADLACAPP